jgi:hypothetical protein
MEEHADTGGIGLESLEGSTDFQGMLRFLSGHLGVGGCVSVLGQKV